ncbi:MAG: hypothetical protein A3A73_04120 [Omnitrophica bacterium RIFCSPLOWO2_01_FULL_50_24]|nr:MAG: hypothetical protein A3A73_04120 [Omnitrophica bacterium RIFCSPLOWO2_01_FULL_50_24]
MTLAQAVILGGLQGLTEFLPVSSSAHLVIVQYWFRLQGPALLVFDVAVHLGTLSAVLVYFAKDLFPITKLGKRMLGMIVLATIPTGVIGLLLKHRIDYFFSTLKPVSIALLVNSLILWSTHCIRSDSNRRMGRWLDAILIGIVQGLSVVPGVSRSGSTISAALWLKLHREDAVRFSFFISIPAILGATVIVLPDAVALLPGFSLPVLLTGVLTAFVTGYFSISILFRMVFQGKLHWFAVYTLLLAAAAFFFSTGGAKP